MAIYTTGRNTFIHVNTVISNSMPFVHVQYSYAFKTFPAFGHGYSKCMIRLENALDEIKESEGE